MITDKIRTLFKSNPEIGFKIEQAYAKRKCWKCRDPIIKNDWHLAVYFKDRANWFQKRKNTCMLCALPALVKRKKDTVAAVAAIEEYLKLNPQIQNRRFLKKIKDGTALSTGSLTEVNHEL